MRSTLIVEDSQDDALLFNRTLKKCGIGNPVHVASNAADALAYLDGGNPCPGIIFMDLRMPGITGLELLGKLKARPDCADVLFFVVSGHDSLQTVRQAYELGCQVVSHETHQAR
jgi:CheY-like chemotaxis protein